MPTLLSSLDNTEEKHSSIELNSEDATLLLRSAVLEDAALDQVSIDLAHFQDLAIKNEEMATAQHRAELAQFLAANEDKLDSDAFLSMFTLFDCATAIQAKYGRLPPNWDLRAFPHAPPKPGDKRTSMSDYKINEILDSERRFLDTILELQRTFVDRLYEIFHSGSEEDKQQLGLTREEADMLFDKLPQIYKFSQALCEKLEPISLVRKPPVTGEGRAIHVGKAFLEMAPKLHVYAPAIISYQQSLQILATNTQRLNENNGKSMNFMQLWEAVSRESAELLRGQQLNAILITPMQRIPRYKMLLEQLAKDCDHEDSIAIVHEASALFASAARNINEAVRSHEKLMGFFGASGGELKLLNSNGVAIKGGELKIVNSYTNGLVG